MKRAAWLDSFLLLVLTSALIWPIFSIEYLDNWPSIESTFIADARMLAARLPHPGWQPLWYCGTRFDYIYPPALRYGTAIISKLGGVSTARAYHLYTGTLYLLGIVSVYWLARIGSGSRGGALLSAAGTALVSPSFLLLPVVRHDSFFEIPQRLHVLMAYGEGPHISALAVMPAALALSFLALRSRNRLALAGAAVLCALTVANNFYGATALAIFFPVLAWSVWVGRPQRSVWFIAAGISALAYALSAFWLTPSYLRVTAMNLSLVAFPGNTWSRLVALLAVLLFCGLTWRWGARKPERVWTIFVAGAGLFLSLYVLGFYYFGFLVAGDPRRLVPELDLALVFVMTGVVRALWLKPNLRVLVLLVPLAAAHPVLRYMRNAYFPFPKAANIDHQYEFLMSKWIHDHLPGARVLPSGTVRFWFDAWFDNSEEDGGSEQGTLNQTLPAALYQNVVGERGDIAILWAQALGTDAVIVPDSTALDHYHDYRKPEKFRGLAPVLYDDQHGTVIYGIRRLYPGIGRVVDTAKIGAIKPMYGSEDVPSLQRYVAAVESPEQGPAPVTWKSFDEFGLQARVSRGQSILLQETYDPAWHAYEENKPLPIRLEPVMNFMLVEVPEGNHQIRMRFETPAENRIGQLLFFAGLAAIVALIWRRKPDTSS